MSSIIQLQSMARLLVIPFIAACAYGNASPEPQYGHTKGNQSSDADNSGVGSDDYNAVPNGCFLNEVFENGHLTMSFVVCPSNPQQSYKWTPDPSPWKGNKSNGSGSKY